MFNLFEVLTIVAVLVVGFIAWQAHKNHATFAAQKDEDMAALKTDLANLKVKSEADLADIKAKISPATPITPVVPVTPNP